MAMSKKDYQAIARVFNLTRSELRTGREDAGVMLRILQNKLADVLAADNPRFDRARFTEACEPAVPLCAQAMGCLCAWHAMGWSADEPCDANEGAGPQTARLAYPADSLPSGARG